jgi:hypothetical protein
MDDIQKVKKTIAKAKRLIKTYEITYRNFNMCDSLERYIQIFENDLVDRADPDHVTYELGILDGGNEIIWEWLNELIGIIEENKKYFLKLKMIRNKKKQNGEWDLNDATCI